MKRDPRIIIIDDDRDLAIHIRSEFRMNGYEAYKAHSAEECIKYMEELDNKVDGIAIEVKTKPASCLRIQQRKL